jgi:hypothetical protein
MAAVAAAVVFHSTPWGPWAGSDSVAYIEAARNLANGRGLVTIQPSGEVSPLSLRPPLYSILLGGLTWLGLDLVQAARWLDAGLMAILIAAIGSGALVLLRQPVVALTLCLALATSPVIVDAYVGVMTEPLALSLGSVCLLLAIACAETGSRGQLVASAAMGALAVLARYSGVVYPFVGMLVVLCHSPAHWARRAGVAATYAVVGLGPYALWVLATGRGVATIGEFQLPQVGLWESTRPLRAAAATIFWRWIPFSEAFGSVAYQMRFAIVALLCALGLMLLLTGFVGLRRSGRATVGERRGFRLGLAFALLSVISAAFVAGTYLLVEYPKPALDDRILSPVYLGALVGGLAALFVSTNALGWRRAAWIVPSTIAVLSILSNLPVSGRILKELHDEGRGYTARGWHNPGILDDVAAIPPSVPLISNDVDAIMLYLDRPAYRIPELERRQLAEEFGRFGADPQDGVQRLFREEGAALVLFGSISGQLIDLYGEDGDARLLAFTEGLEVAADRWDGVIYYYPGARKAGLDS